MAALARKPASTHARACHVSIVEAPLKKETMLMPSTRSGAVATIPAGMGLVVIGMLMARAADTPALGLSSDFWSGSVMGVGIGMLLLGGWVSLRSR